MPSTTGLLSPADPLQPTTANSVQPSTLWHGRPKFWQQPHAVGQLSIPRTEIQPEAVTLSQEGCPEATSAFTGSHVVIVEVGGEIDIESGPCLHDRLCSMIWAHGPRSARCHARQDGVARGITWPR
jgi:hypothetical protein